jgi:hypothetical protein
VPKSKTVTGKDFRYEGSLDRGLVVFFPRSMLKIKPETVRVIRSEIQKRSPVLMGANRKPLVADSVGETLSLEYGLSPQVMSYVLPLLIEEGFCSVNSGKPFVIRLK